MPAIGRHAVAYSRFDSGEARLPTRPTLI